MVQAKRLWLAGLLAVACSNAPSPTLSPDGGGSGSTDPDVAETCAPLEGLAPMDASLEGCTRHPGGAPGWMIVGRLLGPSGIIENGQLLVAADGKIACVGCDCAASAEDVTVLDCPGAVVSPALINAHDHIGFTETPPTPAADPAERFDHRHEWRKGQNGHQKIPAVGNKGGRLGVTWGELRQLLSGTLSLNGSGGADGLLRNVDQSGLRQGGLDLPPVRYSTFPLGDSKGTRIEEGCDYDKLDRPTDGAIQNAIAYTPHIAEGIDESARNEFRCLSSEEAGSDVILDKTGVIHGIGLLPQDLAAMAADGAGLIWSPRSNISLYGMTADVPAAFRMGVDIAMGTDWTATGSMNMLRELACGAELNQRNFGGYFRARDLVDMATHKGARVLGLDARLGALKTGLEADISIFRDPSGAGYQAVLDAQPADVLLVMRSGEALYGDRALLAEEGRPGSGCEFLDVCGHDKVVCVERETGYGIAELRRELPDYTYPLFFCEAPDKEPSCVPFRSGEFIGVGSDRDPDGDGIPSDRDNCPNIFNPVRPLDGDAQGDADGDLIGDSCDACPLDPGEASCSMFDPDDRDRDGVPDGEDNCPGFANPQQRDADGDGLGDACDACRDRPNPGQSACPTTVYEIKRRQGEQRVALASVVVTGQGQQGFFVQMPADHPDWDAELGPRYSGAYVHAPGLRPLPEIGQVVDLEGQTSTFYGARQLVIRPEGLKTTGATAPLPEPQSVSAEELIADGAPTMRAAELEGVRIELRNVVVRDEDPEPGDGDRRPHNEVELDGGLRLNDFLFSLEPLPRTGERLLRVRGILRWANGLYKVEPAEVGDVIRGVALRGFEPTERLVPYVDGPEPHRFTLALALNMPTPTPLDVSVESLSPALDVSSPVRFAADEAEALVEVTVVGLDDAPARIEARHEGQRTEAAIEIYDDAAPRRLEFLRAPSRVGRGQSFEIGLRLLYPAAQTGTPVSFTATPVGLLKLPDQIVLAPGRRYEVLTATASDIAQAGTLEVHTGTTTVVHPIEVVDGQLRPIDQPGDLVLTELHRNPSGPDEFSREWFEVYNPTPDHLMWTGLELQDSRGRFRFPEQELVIPPGGYAVIGYSDDARSNGGVAVDVAYGQSGIILGNNKDALGLYAGGTEIFRIEWNNDWPSVNGTSLCLRAPYGDATERDAWGLATTPFGDNDDLGHPGAPSTADNCMPFPSDP